MLVLPEAQRRFDRMPVRFALGVCALMRLVWAAIALLGLHFQVHMERFWHVAPSGLGYFHTPVQLVDIWARWDAIFYLRLAAFGYDCAPDFLCTAFFPLFSVLIWLVHALSGLSYLTSGLLLANACDAAGFVLVALWLKRRLPGPQAFWAWVAFAAFPTRNFGFSVYTEGLFLSLSVGAYLAYETRRYALSGLLSALCSASRPQGLLVGVSLVADGVWLRLGHRRSAPPRRGLLALCTAPLGLIAYMAYLYTRFGDPLMFVRVQSIWHRQVQAPWRIIGVHAEPIEYVVLGCALVLCGLSVKRRQPVRDSLYVALSLLVPMCTGRFTSINRFVGVLFPMFALAAQVPPKPRYRRLYAVLCAIYTVVFAFKLGQGAKVI